jgi:hypothetical protein
MRRQLGLAAESQLRWIAGDWSWWRIFGSRWDSQKRRQGRQRYGGLGPITLGLWDLRQLLLRFLGFCDSRNILRRLIGLGLGSSAWAFSAGIGI